MSMDDKTVGEQHAMIGIRPSAATQRTRHPDAQWFGNAGLGLFLHWGLASVCGEGNLSWAMMHPMPDEGRQIIERYGNQGVGKTVTPAEYWTQAQRFNPDRYDPDQ